MTESAGHTYAARCSLQPVTLCAFLTFSVLAVAFHSQRWCRACALTADETSWADPWMRDWIAEQEAKQDVPELSSGSDHPCPVVWTTSLPGKGTLPHHLPGCCRVLRLSALQAHARRDARFS